MTSKLESAFAATYSPLMKLRRSAMDRIYRDWTGFATESVAGVHKWMRIRLYGSPSADRIEG
jgi:hypothetical protein